MVHERIREARLQAGLTQREVSERTGIAEPTLRSYEAGRLNPKYETIQKIADALGTPVLKLLDPEMYEQQINDLESQQRQIQQSITNAEFVLKNKNNIDSMSEEGWAAVLETLQGLQQQVNLQLAAARAGKGALQAEQALTIDKKRSLKRTNTERLFLAFGRLNAKGQKEALKRVEELGRLPEYLAADKRHI